MRFLISLVVAAAVAVSLMPGKTLNEKEAWAKSTAISKAEKALNSFEAWAYSTSASPSGGSQRVTVGASASAQPPKAHSNAELASLEQRMVQLVNEERAKAGLKSLEVDPRLVRLARLKSKDMVEKGYLGHISPTLGDPYSMERAAGIEAKSIGAENLASALTMERAHNNLMNSPGHRANILKPGFTAVGIGIVDGGSGVVVTQLFIGN